MTRSFSDFLVGSFFYQVVCFSSRLKVNGGNACQNVMEPGSNRGRIKNLLPCPNIESFEGYEMLDCRRKALRLRVNINL